MSTSAETPPKHFLTALPEGVRAQLETLSERRHFHSGTMLFQEGARHDQVYVVLSGTVRLEMFLPAGGRQQLMTVGPGDVVGWSPLLGNETMTATAIALEPVQTLAIHGRRLREFCDANHEAGYDIMLQFLIVVSERLLATRRQLVEQLRLPAPQGPLVTNKT